MWSGKLAAEVIGKSLAREARPPAFRQIRKARPQGADVLLARGRELLHHAVHGIVFAAAQAPRPALRRQRRAGRRIGRRLVAALAPGIFFPARQTAKTLAARAAHLLRAARRAKTQNCPARKRFETAIFRQIGHPACAAVFCASCRTGPPCRPPIFPRPAGRFSKARRLEAVPETVPNWPAICCWPPMPTEIASSNFPKCLFRWRPRKFPAASGKLNSARTHIHGMGAARRRNVSLVSIAARALGAKPGGNGKFASGRQLMAAGESHARRNFGGRIFPMKRHWFRWWWLLLVPIIAGLGPAAL
jgi:hypothetical protein